MSGVDIVPITEAHIPGFHACLDSVARERRFLAMVEAPPLERVAEFVSNGIAQGMPQVVAVTATGDVVGWCDVSPGTLEGFTHAGCLEMGVRADCRGLGIGRRLLDSALALARKAGIERVDLEVYAGNTPAISLYERSGFAVEGVKRRARKTDRGYEDLVMMAIVWDATL